MRIERVIKATTKLYSPIFLLENQMTKTATTQIHFRLVETTL